MDAKEMLLLEWVCIYEQLCNKLGHAITIASVYGEYTEVEIAFGKETFLTKE